MPAAIFPHLNFESLIKALSRHRDEIEGDCWKCGGAFFFGGEGFVGAVAGVQEQADAARKGKIG